VELFLFATVPVGNRPEISDDPAVNLCFFSANCHFILSLSAADAALYSLFLPTSLLYTRYIAMSTPKTHNILCFFIFYQKMSFERAKPPIPW